MQTLKQDIGSLMVKLYHRLKVNFININEPQTCTVKFRIHIYTH